MKTKWSKLDGFDKTLLVCTIALIILILTMMVYNLFINKWDELITNIILIAVNVINLCSILKRASQK